MAIGDQYIRVPRSGKHLRVVIESYTRADQVRRGDFLERYIGSADDLRAVIDALTAAFAEQTDDYQGAVAEQFSK